MFYSDDFNSLGIELFYTLSSAVGEGRRDGKYLSKTRLKMSWSFPSLTCSKRPGHVY
jgi:hypothetical protein